MKRKKIMIIIIVVVCVIILSVISSIISNKKYEENNKEVINAVNIKGVTKSKEYKDVLNGKSVSMIGDSLIAGYGNENGGLDFYLSQIMPNAYFSNSSVSGSTVTNNTGAGNIVMVNQARNLGGNPNIILFDGGVNDIIGYDMNFISNDLKKPIGTVNKENNNSVSENTVMADFEEVIQVLKSRFPNSTLCYLQLCLLDDTSINMLAKQVEHKDEMKIRRDEFFTQMKLLCEKWNVNYLDLSPKFVGTGISFRQEDWLHINDDGYKMLAPYILSYMSESIQK